MPARILCQPRKSFSLHSASTCAVCQSATGLFFHTKTHVGIYERSKTRPWAPSEQWWDVSCQRGVAGTSRYSVSLPPRWWPPKHARDCNKKGSYAHHIKRCYTSFHQILRPNDVYCEKHEQLQKYFLFPYLTAFCGIHRWQRENKCDLKLFNYWRQCQVAPIEQFNALSSY